jgi:dnd system-associated protein 4
MSEQELSRGDRINISDSVIDIYKQLTENSSAEESPFVTYKDVFMFAMCLGSRTTPRQKLPSGKKHQIRRDIFTAGDFAFINAVAIAETGDVQVLSRLDEVLTIAEEYAQAGIYEMKSQLLEQRGRPLWNLIERLTIQP